MDFSYKQATPFTNSPCFRQVQSSASIAVSSVELRRRGLLAATGRGDDARATNEITSSALTKAFLNCNELPKSELCAVQVPSRPRRAPSYKTPRYTYAHVCMYVSRHPCGRASATPRHEYIYIDRPSRHFSFGSSLCRTRAREVCPSLRYFIYIDGTCLSF